MKLATLLTAGLMLAITQLAVAGDVIAPDVMVKNTANEVLEIVRKDKDIQAGDTQKIVAITQEKIVPHFNFERMSRMVLGRAWVKASDEQKEKFQTEFRNLLVRTYSSALAKYRNQTIEYKPLRAGAGDTEVVVKTQIVQPGGPPIPIDYSMERKDDAWKVYDVKIDGISLVTNYKGQFATDLRQGSLDVVIQKLVDKNQQLLAKKQEKS
ncbi:MAG: ABC transporter substrate-binding protein [Methylophilales bacterium]|nr:ABC transporter substrate-binding protein [Methylophilales bacterium]